MNRTRCSKLFFPRFRAVVAPRLAPPLAAALLFFSFAGCLSTSVQIRPGGEAGKAGILVRVFADHDASKAGRPTVHGTLVELYRLEGDEEVFLQRSLAGEWGVDGLPPGRYRLKVPAVIDAGGNIRETRSGDRETDIKVKSGQTAEVKIILKKTPTGLIVAASITVVVLVVALAILLGEGKGGDLPVPPLPPKELLLPPPGAFLPRPVVVSAEIWIPVPVGRPAPEHTIPPRVTSVIPEPGSTVGQRRVKPTLTLSQPVDEARLAPDAILMLGSVSGLVSGRTIYRLGLLQFEPDRDLAPGESVTVTVRARGVVNPAGRHLDGDFSWTFAVARPGETPPG